MTPINDLGIQVTMNHDEIRHHIESGAAHKTRGLTSRILGAYWPGGAEDRTERAALDWLRLWRPQRAGAPLPVCSCVTGRCAVCN